LIESSVYAERASRVMRGLALFRERGREMERVAPWTWMVPSRAVGLSYTADLKAGSCTCPDHRRRQEACKHLYAAEIARAKTALCDGCGRRFPRRELTELHEDNHDDLTYFHGDRLCGGCADGAGVIR
jgi:hypothetical protein